MKIPKKLFDELVAMSRTFWVDCDENGLLKERIQLAMQISEKTGIDWAAIIDFVDSIIRNTGISPGASDKLLYFALRVFGWEIDNEVQKSESL